MAAWGEQQHPPLRAAVDFKQRDLSRYLAERRLNDGIGPASVALAISACRTFFAWVLGKRRSPARGLVYPREELHEQRTLTPQQAARVLEVLETSSVIGQRDLAILCLMLDTGLRASEVCHLTLGGVHLLDAFLTVRGKRGKLLTKAFCGYTAMQLANWLSVRQAVAGCDRFFVSVAHGVGRAAPPGKALTRQAIRGICNRVAKGAGIPALSPHDLRRTCTYIALLRGCPDRIAKLQLGWGESTTDMLSRYSLALRVQQFVQYSPVDWLMSGGYAKNT
jgi:site-specific recombinase XerC